MFEFENIRRPQLKRKLYEADFESVESLKGLELNGDSNSSEDSFEEIQPIMRHERKRHDSENAKVRFTNV